MKNLIGYASFAAFILMASPGFAQDREDPPISPESECTVDADCMDGDICEIAVEDVACTPCLEGEECEPCPEPQSFGFCTSPPPPPCASDADCASGDVCVTYSYEICSGSSGGSVAPCAPDEPCETMPDPEPEPDTGSCSTETESLCVPQFVAPCQVDSDCGSGFTCTNIEICACSSGGGDTMDGSDEGAPEMDPCTCEPTGEKYCELDEVACTSDADCSGELICIDLFASRPEVTCVDTPDGDAVCDEPIDPVTPEQYCAPAGYDDWGGVSGGPSLAPVAEATGQNEDDFSSADRIDWGPEASSGSKSDSSGCSAAGADASVFGLLLIAGMLLRRRN